MKKLNSLNLGKSLNREEMKSISGGSDPLELEFSDAPACTCGTKPKAITHCGCEAFCAGTCS